MFCFHAAGPAAAAAPTVNHWSKPGAHDAGVEFLQERRRSLQQLLARGRFEPGLQIAPRCRSAGSPASRPARRGSAARTDSPGTPATCAWAAAMRCSQARKAASCPGLTRVAISPPRPAPAATPAAPSRTRCTSSSADQHRLHFAAATVCAPVGTQPSRPRRRHRRIAAGSPSPPAPAGWAASPFASMKPGNSATAALIVACHAAERVVRPARAPASA